jgi:hypothetical protein
MIPESYRKPERYQKVTGNLKRYQKDIRNPERSNSHECITSSAGQI